jgi:hypothetical protein
MATKKELIAQEVAKAVGAGKTVALETVDFNDPNRPKTCLEVDFPILPVPGGHLKLPHPWPGQIPPAEAAGRVDGYTLSARFATRAAASRRRQLLPSNFSRCAWCISRSSSGVTMTTSPSSLAQSSTGRLDVMIVERFS